MASAFGRVAATRGLLLRLKDQLKFVKKGLEVLKMKRDHIAGEVNKLLEDVRRRPQIERKAMEIYEYVKDAYLSVGYQRMASMADVVGSVEIRPRTITVMGVRVPVIDILREPDISRISDPVVAKAAILMWDLLKDVIGMAVVETTIEKLAYELMETNRKVNALEKEIIPSLADLIRYIEDRLHEEELADFIRVKHIRDVLRGRRG